MAKMPHIQLDETIDSTCAILPGDPARVDHIATYLTDVREGTFNREYKSLTGMYNGKRILAISTGMGGASTAICVEELADLGVKNMIRIGSCGALQEGLKLGELVICDRAVCDDGTSQTYMNYLRYAGGDLKIGALTGGEVAMDDSVKATISEDGLLYAQSAPEMVELCRSAAQEKGFAHAIGATRCHDGLYLPEKPQLDEYYSSKGVFASDMETAALLAVAKRRGVNAAGILNVVVEWKANLKDGISDYKGGADAAAAGEEHEIIVALEALSRA